MTSPVVQANIEVHTRMADSYTRVEPHFRPENRAKVRRTLEDLRRRCGGGRMLDLGCGTGFLIAMATDLFDEIHGVDVTQAMLDQVDTSSGKVTLHNTPAEKLPFPDEHFDLVAAYSFLHHTEDFSRVMREALRVLRRGGICYIDLEPNKLFWDSLAQPALDRPDLPLPPLVAKAREAALHTDEKIQREFGIDKETFRQAEYGKAILGGIDPNAMRLLSSELGFSACTVRPHWFLGQADIMHGQSFELADQIDAHLRSLSPLADHLFKYLQIVLVK